MTAASALRSACLTHFMLQSCWARRAAARPAPCAAAGVLRWAPGSGKSRRRACSAWRCTRTRSPPASAAWWAPWWPTRACWCCRVRVPTQPWFPPVPSGVQRRALRRRAAAPTPHAARTRTHAPLLRPRAPLLRTARALRGAAPVPPGSQEAASARLSRRLPPRRSRPGPLHSLRPRPRGRRARARRRVALGSAQAARA